MIKIYNTLAGKKQVLKPIHNKEVKFYACGPTVYDRAHLGNLRTYIFEDVLRRTLKRNGYKVRQIMNITDIEDKIIKRAEEENKKPKDIAEFYEKIFFEDLKKLNIEKAEYYPRATDNIKAGIELIKKLIKKCFAYQGKDKSVYFNISKFKNYGKLSNLKKRTLKMGIGITADEYDKKEAADFVLWKSAKKNEPLWQSPWGPGRPGWHIECSAMSMKYLGEKLDIHAGGVDLIFPHHENEIAQSEAASNKKFANYWIHGEHLLINGRKMSKSLKNTYTLKDLENKNVDPVAFRYLVLTGHYRSKMNFTWNSMAFAENSLNNIRKKLYAEEKSPAKRKKQNYLKYEEKFLSAVNNDLNTPKAVSIIWEILKNKNLEQKEKQLLIHKFDEILGLKLKEKPVEIPRKIGKMAQQREILRRNKQFIKADALRKKIEKLGYIVEDTISGPKIK